MRRRITALTVLLVLIWNCLPALAAPQTTDLFEQEEQGHIVVSIAWDTEEPDILLLAPGGAQYNPKDPDDIITSTIYGEGVLFFRILNAPAGQWRITYDKKSNAEIEVSVDPYDEGLWIEEFQIGAVNGTSLPVSFLVEHDETRDYQYTLSLVTDHSTGETTLQEGSARTGNTVERSLDLRSTYSHSSYMIKLYVWYVNDGMDIFDVEYSDVFSYTNPNMAQMEGELLVTVRPLEWEVEADWSVLTGWGDQMYLAALFVDGESEPAAFQELETDFKQAVFAYDPDAAGLRLEFSTRRSNMYAQPLTKTIPLAAARTVRIEMPEWEVTGTPQLPFAHAGADNLTAEVTVNEKSSLFLMDGEGEKLIALEDEWNRVVLAFTDLDGVRWEYRKTVYVDRIPPALRLLENYSNVQTKEASLLLAGFAEGCEGLTVNGDPVELDEEGGFLYEAALSWGRNLFEFSAEDAAGNRTGYTAVIIRTDGTVQAADGLMGRWMPLILALVLSAALGACAWVIWRRPSKGEGK